MAGLIGSSQSSGHLKAHLLQRLPQVFSMISSWGFIQGLGTVYRSDLLSGYNLLKVSQTFVLSLRLVCACTPNRMQSNVSVLFQASLPTQFPGHVIQTHL